LHQCYRHSRGKQFLGKCQIQKLSAFKESWQKKGPKKLKVGLFKSDFSGLNKVREEHLESCRLKMLNDTIQLDHSYTLENTSFKMEDNFKKVITDLFRIAVLNISRFVYQKKF